MIERVTGFLNIDYKPFSARFKKWHHPKNVQRPEENVWEISGIDIETGEVEENNYEPIEETLPISIPGTFGYPYGISSQTHGTIHTVSKKTHLPHFSCLDINDVNTIPHPQNGTFGFQRRMEISNFRGIQGKTVQGSANARTYTRVWYRFDADEVIQYVSRA